MTLEQARLELDATTLRPVDASEEARSLARSDPRLNAWITSRRDFDERIAKALAQMNLPAGTPPPQTSLPDQALKLLRKLMTRAHPSS
jgi:hypothetical protein